MDPELLDQLREEYRQGLQERIAELERALTAETRDTQTLTRVAHRLRGSGATYGYPEITQAAQGLEEADAADLERATHELLDVLRRVTS